MSGDGFSNTVVGGSGTLVRESIHSPNYVTGVSGWRIGKDGTVEFNAGEYRGSVQFLDNGGVFFYTTTTPQLNSLLLSISPVAGNDGHGNTFPQGITFFDANATGQQIASWSEAGGISLSDSLGKGVILQLISTLLSLVSGAAPTGTTAAYLRALNGLLTAGLDTAVFSGPRSTAATDNKLSAAQVLLTQGGSADGAAGALAIDDTSGTAQILQWAITGITIATLLTLNGRASITSASTSGALSIFQTVATTGNPATIVIQETASGNGSFAVYVNGDAHARIVIRASGEIDFGPGSASPDTSFKRASAGLLEFLQSIQVDGRITATGGTASAATLITTDSWQTPALGVGWATGTNDGTGQPIQYRLETNGMVHIFGSYHSISATPSATVWTFASPYIPLKVQRTSIVEVAGTSAFANWLQVATSGAVQAGITTTASGTDYHVDMYYRVN